MALTYFTPLEHPLPWGWESDHETVCPGQPHGEDTKTFSREEKVPSRTSCHWHVRSMADSGGSSSLFLCP